MNSSLSLYHIFYEVAKKGNISLAAKELFISQPAVSKSINRLEENLNTILFVRSSRGVALTEEGSLLFDHVSTAFDSLNQGEELLNRIHSLGMGTLRIGVSTTLCKYVLLPYLKGFIEQNPHIRINISCQSTFHTVKRLEEGKLDIGLIGNPKESKTLNFFPVIKIEDTFVATKSYLNHLKIRHSGEALHLFQDGNVMLLDEENITRRYIEDYFKNQKIELNQVLEVSSMDLLIEFAKIGMGAACVIREFVKEELGAGVLTELTLPAPIPSREIGFSYSKNAFLTASIKSFIAFYTQGENQLSKC